MLKNFMEKIKKENFKNHLRQLFFFSIGALLSFGFNLILTSILVEIFSFNQNLAIAISSFFFYTFAFVFNTFITFKSSISKTRIVKYLLVLSLAYFLNNFLAYLLIGFADIFTFLSFIIPFKQVIDLVFRYYYLIAMVISMSVVMVFKYLIYHYWVFAEPSTFSKKQDSRISTKTEKSSKIVLKIDSLDQKGFGVGILDNKKWRVLNSLPNEVVELVEYKKGRKPKGIAGKILKKSEFRVLPKDIDSFISTSPWQILDLNEENRIKKENIKNYFKTLAGIDLPTFDIYSPSFENSYNYRNKVEFSFYGFDETEEISLAFFKKGSSRGKIPVSQTSLANQKINLAAQKINNFLNIKKIKARNLKSLILRHSNFEDKVIAGIFVKDLDLAITKSELLNLLDENLKGIALIYSKPQSPASVITKIEISVGELFLQEKVLDTIFNYNLSQFFQVNIQAFEQVILDLRKYLQENKNYNPKLLDMYAGVGTIGLSLRNYFEQIKAVELSLDSQIFAYKNALQNRFLDVLEKQAEFESKFQELFLKNAGMSFEDNFKALLETVKTDKFNFIQASSESCLEHINADQSLILDPPRTGLHLDLINTILLQKPKLICYLSCNPETQARDLKLLKEVYKIDFFKAYNFYPHTPHCESLAIMIAK
jgi:23S rRNA (uracil1939-C5)-methyltransferase